MANGHIIAVVGGKGGVGKSVFTSNLAVSYLQNFKQRPLIVDLDLMSLGDQNFILGQQSAKSIVDVSRLPPGNIDPKVLAPFMINAPQGYSFIAAPKDATTARDLDLEGLGRFLKASTQIFQWVVVDCGNLSEAASLKVLEFASAIMVVTSPDMIVINQTKRILSKLTEMLFHPDSVQVIVNRVGPSQTINPQFIQKNLNKNIFAMIPEDPASCEAALARSTPVVLLAPQAPITRAYADLVRRIQQTQLLENLSKLKKPTGLASKAAAAAQQSAGGAATSGSPITGGLPQLDPWSAVRLRLLKGLVDELDLSKMDPAKYDPREAQIMREKTAQAVAAVMAKEDVASVLTTRELKAKMVKEVVDEAIGLGPLEELLADDSVSEIMVNARDQIYIEKGGKPAICPVTFTSEQQMRTIIERIVLPLGRKVDLNSPYADARLPDGSRVHVIIPPLALRGPTITIRKFPKKRITYKDLVAYGSMTEEIADFLRCCVEGKLNIVVSGGTGSGKTTLLNVLSNFIPSSDRIITVEDSAELQLAQEHVVRLETKPKSNEGAGEVSIRDLIKCCLRMRPDRIVVGECRGGEALDMLQAMNTGHAGSLTTVHSNNPRECIARLETLVMMSGVALPLKAIKDNIASAVNLIVQQQRLVDGSRKVTHITAVTGMEGDTVSMQDVFTYKTEGLDKNRKIIGRFVPSGLIPPFVKEMEAKGIKLPKGIFAAK